MFCRFFSVKAGHFVMVKFRKNVIKSGDLSGLIEFYFPYMPKLFKYPPVLPALRPGLRPLRPALRRTARVGPRRHRSRFRTRHHHHGPAWRSLHLRRQGQHGGRSFVDPHHPEPQKRHGPDEHHRPHADRRDRHPSNRFGPASEPSGRFQSPP